MPVVKNQHYVPRFYLRQFSRDGIRVHAFDKVQNRSFLAGVSDVACAKYFYDFEPSVSGDDDVQVVEKGLAKIEAGSAAEFRSLLTELPQTNRFDLANLERKRAIAYFIALQYCRTLQFRTLQSQMAQGLADFINRIYPSMHPLRDNDSGESESMADDVSAPAEVTALEHADFIFNSGFIERAMDPIVDCIWIVYDNQDQGAFYVSDSPVVLVPHLNDAGFGSKGIQVVLPLSSRYVLTLWERTHFQSALIDHEGTVMPMNPCCVPIYNAYQVMSSARQVYCADNDFEIIPDLIARSPELANPNRPRITFR